MKHPDRASRRTPKLTRPLAALGAASLVAVGLTATPAAADVEGDIATLDVLGITDFHGALAQAPLLADAINEIDNEDKIFVSAGDQIGGSTFESSIQDDDPTIEVLNEMGLATSAVGNHEFDAGYDDLSGRVADLANWDYLGANVDGETPDMPATHVWDSPSGVSVGFVGTVTTETPDIVAPGGIEGIDFTDEAEATNTHAAQLSDSGEADIVVALAHVGANDSFLSALSDDVDAVFTGHTHVEVNNPDQYAFPVIQGGASGSHLSRVTFTYDVSTDEVTGATASNIAMQEQPDNCDWVDAADNCLGEDQEVRDTVIQAFTEAEDLGSEVLGYVDGAFNRGSNTGEPDGSNRGVESPLGNLLGEVAKYTAETIGGQDVDFGIINSGGIRADLDPDGDGEVTFSEAYTVQPFGNTIGTIDLTGAQVVTMLEQQFQPDGERPVLRLGLSDDIEYVYDPQAPQGERITSVYIANDDGEVAPIDPEATYTVASNTFLIAGQDGFTVFEEAPTNELGIVDREGFEEYIAEYGTADSPLTPDYSQRSVGVTGPSAISAGDEVTLELSSLAFTTTEPAPEEVTVSLGGDVLGTAPVDATVIPHVDETGTATVTFTVPGTVVPGEMADLVIATDQGTEVTYPVEVTGAPEDSQMDQIPVGGVETGGGPTAGLENGGLITLGSVILGAGAIGLLLSRRRSESLVR